MKKLAIIFIFVFAIVFCFIRCSSVDSKDGAKYIGIYLPSVSPERWVTEGEEMTKILENKGYIVDLFYADKDVELQKSQMETGIDNDVAAMIVAAVDPNQLSDVLLCAADKGIKIIAYDRFIGNCECINYYVSYDSKLVGIQQGRSLVEGLHRSGNPPYNVELFAGCNADSNAKYFYEGAMSILQPLIDSGEIVVLSDEIEFEDVSLEFKNPDYPKERMSRLLETYYCNADLDGILSPNDVTSLKIIDTLDTHTSFSQSYYPVITGQDAEIESVIAITQSKQYSTVFKDSKLLSQMAASMVIAILNDETPEINDTTSFSNGNGIVPSFLCEPVLVNKDNYKEILIDTGYMKYEDVFPEPS